MKKLLYSFILVSLFLVGCTITPETGNEMLDAKAQCEAEPTCKAVLDQWQEEVNHKAYIYFEEQFLNEWILSKNEKDAEQDARLDVLEAGLLEKTSVREKITFEYDVITEEAVANGWTCETVTECINENKPFKVISYDPAEIGIHKFDIQGNFEYFAPLYFSVVFVNEYNEFLGEETYTISDFDGHNYTIIIKNYLEDTKYVKFKDITNIIYRYRDETVGWECKSLNVCTRYEENVKIDVWCIERYFKVVFNYEDLQFDYEDLQFNIVLSLFDENNELIGYTTLAEIGYENLVPDPPNVSIGGRKEIPYLVFYDHLYNDAKYVKFHDITNIIPIKKDS